MEIKKLPARKIIPTPANSKTLSTKVTSKIIRKQKKTLSSTVVPAIQAESPSHTADIETIKTSVPTPPIITTPITEGFSIEASAESSSIPDKQLSTTALEIVPIPLDITDITPDTPQPISTIPVLDKNAELKIDTITTEEDLPQEEKHGILLYILGSIFAVLILIGAGTFAFFYFKSPTPATVIQPTVSPTPRITETPKVVVLNSEISFEVLNASGKTGEAARYGKLLEAQGYKISLLGNSPAQTGLSVYISKTLDSQKDKLISDLKAQFPTSSYSGELTDSTSSARIIIGK